MQTLQIVSCHAANLDASVQRIVAYLHEALGWSFQFVNDIPWPERYHRLDEGMIDVAWICGAPYVQRMATLPGNIELLAAPVWRGERYAGRPAYFADIIVRATSRVRRLADLRGATWVYNEPASLSGFVAMQHYLVNKGESDAFFGAIRASGGHLHSLELLLNGHADVTALDSVVLAEHVRAHPDVDARIRLLDSVGPLPSMPWVASTRLPVETRMALRQALVQMGEDADGQVALCDTPLTGFAPVVDGDYDPIRAMVRDLPSKQSRS